MRIRRLLAALTLVGLAGALALATVTVASPPEDRFVEFTKLTGAEEVPGPGDPDGRGFAIIRSRGDGEICYLLRVQRIDPSTAAHIHIGGQGVAGPVVQGLAPPTDGRSAGCVDNPALAAAIADNPSNYYVNVHNIPFPAGAVRGQLD